MRKTCSILLFLFIFSNSTFAQQPYIIVDTTKEWNTMPTGGDIWNVTRCGRTITTRFGEEYILNDLIYKKVLECEDTLQTEWDWEGLIYEDTISKQVFYAWSEDDVGLIYDFNIGVGDTVNITNHYFHLDFTSTLVCDSIDSILIYGVQRKRFYFYADYSDRTNYNEIWIEGIGSLYGVMYSGFGGFLGAGGWLDLLCSSKNDTLEYKNERFDTCYMDKFYPDILSEYYDTAYVNQPYEFHLQLDTLGVDSFALIPEVIPDDFYFDTSTGILYGNPDSAGTFACIITVDNYDYNLKTDIIYEDIVVLLEAGNEETLSKPKFTIYPNPIPENFTVISPGFTETKLEIYSNQGVKILEKQLNNEKSFLSAENLSTGMLFLVFKDKSGKIISVERVLKK